MKSIHVTTTVNGEPAEFICTPDETLLDVLRNRLGLTGSKEGCGTGDCGACSVTVNGRLVCSCLVLGAEAEGAEITTIEGMASGEALHPLQRHFNAASAHREFWLRPRRFSNRIPTRATAKSATGSRATFAAAPAMTRSSMRSNPPPPK